MLGREAEGRPVEFISRRPTRRTPDGSGSNKSRGKITWIARGRESRDGAGPPPTEDSVAEVGCPRPGAALVHAVLRVA